MTIYTRKGYGHTYTLAEAVKTSLTEDLSYSDGDGSLERMQRQIDGIADAVGHLAEVLARVVAPEFVEPALTEILSYKFQPKTEA